MIHINNNFYDIIFYNKNGKLHRIDGPAFIEENYQEWWIDGIIHTESEFIAFQKCSDPEIKDDDTR